MKHYQVVVIGGGLSGVAAAVSAAREGLSVLLIERTGCLGGAMSNSAVFPFMKHAMRQADGSLRYLSAGIFTEMCRRHCEMGGLKEGRLQPEFFKLTLDEMICEAGVEVLFHTQLTDAVLDGRKIRAVRAAGKAGVMEITGDFFIDASGDGDLMAFSGCDYQLGRESDSLCQPMTTCFRVSGVDMKQFEADRAYLQMRYKELQAEGKILNPRENLLIFTGLGEGILHFNSTRIIRHNPVDPIELSKAELLARKQVLELYRFLKENSSAFADSCLISIAQDIGVRESRKLRGVHILTADELKNCVNFPDTIALGNYDIDIHNPAGTGTYIYNFKPEEYYRIPYRSLLPKERDNLLVAGRCLSATHEAHSAVRIMPICACLGQAAGIAAATAVKTNTSAHTVDIAAVQKKLEDAGAAIR